jgi:hypothetical protein
MREDLATGESMIREPKTRRSRRGASADGAVESGIRVSTRVNGDAVEFLCEADWA